MSVDDLDILLEKVLISCLSILYIALMLFITYKLLALLWSLL